MKLRNEDFPITAVRGRIYARSHSSALAIVWDDELAQELALRLNRDDCAYPSSPGCEHKAVAGPCSICGDMG